MNQSFKLHILNVSFCSVSISVYSSVIARMYKEVSSLFYISKVVEDSNRFEPIFVTILMVL
jgi:hypothetical protein